jgi:uncharacterized protein (DUF1778 family)
LRGTTHPLQNQSRAVPINIRARSSQRNLIDKAAAMLNKNRSDFMLEGRLQSGGKRAARPAALYGGAASLQSFETLIEAPVKDNPALRRMLKNKAPWEK